MNPLSSLAIRSMGLTPHETRTKVVSTRAPQGALLSPGYSLPNTPLYPEFSGEAAIDQAYLRNVYTYRCIDTIANTIAGWPFRAGDQVTNNFRLTHPMAQLLGPAIGSPNPNWSSHTLWRYSIAQYLLLGKFAWAIEREPGTNRIVGLWPLQAQYLLPIPAYTGSLFFSKFRYGTPGNANYKEYNPDEIMYAYRPSLKDFRQPESPVQAAAVNINISKMLDQFDNNFLRNGGVPAHLIVTPPWATEQDRTNFQQQFLADFTGPANVGRVAFAERDMIPGESPSSPTTDTVDIKTIGISQRDAQLALLRDAEIQAVCLAWGVPLSIMGDASHRTFSNAIDERTNYIQHTCLPRARELADNVNIQLAPLFDPAKKTVGWFDTTAVPELKPAPLFSSDSDALSLLQAEVLTKDEYRASKGLPTAADVGLDPKMAPPPPPPVPFAPSDPSNQPTDGTKPAPAAKDAGAKVLPAASSPDPVTRSALRAGLADFAASIQEQSQGKRARRGETPDINLDYWTSRISDTLEARTASIPASEVERSLIDLYDGSTTVETILRRWQDG